MVYQLSSKTAIDWDKLVNQLRFEIRIDWDALQTSQKYYEQAKAVLYRINLYDLSVIDINTTSTIKSKAVFIINTSDLTRSLRTELEQVHDIDPMGFDKVVTEAVQTLFEGINARYYHITGLSYKVTWRFEH